MARTRDQARAERPTDGDYRTLLEFRTRLRRFLRWSEHAAKEAGLHPSMHQLLLAIRGCGIEGGPRITEIAEYLVVRHHTAVEIIDRAERAGLVRRAIDPIDSRAVRVQLTNEGQERLAALTRQHLDELQQFLPVLSRLDQGLPDSDGPLVDHP